MATQVKRSAPKKTSRQLKKSSKMSWKLILPFIALAVAGGVYFVFTSHAGTAVYSRSGYMDWRDEGTTKIPTGRVTSKDGKICVAANFNTYNGYGSGFGQGYYFHVYGIERGQWVKLRSSQKFQINGNRDHACFDAGVNRGGSYRIGYDPINRTYMHGTYWVWGYNHN